MNKQTSIATPIKRISTRDLAAVEWLAGYLKDGPKLVGAGRAAARAAGIVRGALLRARRILGMKSRGGKGNQYTCWELPSGPPFKLPKNVTITKYEKNGPVG